MADDESGILAVVFDIDDTLYPERDFVRSGYHAIAEHLRSQLSRDEPFEDWLWRRFLSGETARAFDDLDSHFQLSLSQPAIGELVKVYRFHIPDITPFDGIEAVLKQLSGRVRLGIVSDGPARMQRNKLQALSLASYFDAVILTDELGPGAGKPSPVGFEIAREELGVPHGACAYVSDNPAKDFIAPNRLGWRTIRYLREGQVYADCTPPLGGEAQQTVQNDTELLTAVEWVAGGLDR
jgi:putative hydrolase of the HAD superfamily